ncbi:21 kDa protein-like [Neltuma alba]|uniref:21 kDa protein-like n=1 Tax=Neltuma alba TaxID=207710 RepID=UPI0010A33C29|nr:21 kDa protein-like [Prosopis alba]
MTTQSPRFLPSLLLLTVTLYNLRTTAAAVRSSAAANPDAATFIRTSCRRTLYPDLCVSSLSSFTNTIQNNHAMLARAAITVSLSRAQSMASYVSNLLRQANKNADSGTASALRDCSYSLGVAVDNIRGSFKQMQQMTDKSAVNGEKFRFQMSSVQTWMSTAMTEEQACSERFDASPDGRVKTDVRRQVTEVKKFISNALALVQGYGNNVRKH